MAKAAAKKTTAKSAKKTTKKAVKATPKKKVQSAPKNQSENVEISSDSQPVLEVVTEEVVASAKSLQPVATKTAENTISVKLSEALYRKLTKSAEEEGIDLGAFVTELLAEGVVLRAWEIVERKNAMRGDSAPNGNSNQGGNFNRGNNGNNRHRNNNRQQRRGNHQQNQGWMDDRASFLEYVRNQEKRQR